MASGDPEPAVYTGPRGGRQEPCLLLKFVHTKVKQMFCFVLFFPFVPAEDDLDPGLMGPGGTQAECSPIPLPTLSHAAPMPWTLTSLTMAQEGQLPLVTSQFQTKQIMPLG